MTKEQIENFIDKYYTFIDKHDLLGVYAALSYESNFGSLIQKDCVEFLDFILEISEEDCQEFMSNMNIWDLTNNQAIHPLHHVSVPYDIEFNYTPKFALAYGGLFEKDITIKADKLCEQFLYTATAYGDIHIEEGCTELESKSLQLSTYSKCNIYLPSSLEKVALKALPHSRDSNIAIYYNGTRKQFSDIILTQKEIDDRRISSATTAKYVEVGCTDGVWDGYVPDTWDI